MRFKESRSDAMLDQFSRTELLLGREGVERLARAHVAVFGLGGVGAMPWRPWSAAAWEPWT